jgi:glucose-1-phosphate cytidylyltransferase
MKTAILCGGKGTRLGNVDVPKALIEVGGKPILWHVMKIYKHFGHNDFILCLGHKGDMIRNYFKDSTEFNIEFVDTGEDTLTGGRIKKIEHLIENDDFFCTYCDGVSNIDINKLLEFHKNCGKTVTISVIQQHSQFGKVTMNENDMIQSFKEKPLLDFWINGGFFVFNKKIFKELDNDEMMVEGPFERLAKINQICAFKHNGFWKCMDTLKDTGFLNDQWNINGKPWKCWND